MLGVLVGRISARNLVVAERGHGLDQGLALGAAGFQEAFHHLRIEIFCLDGVEGGAQFVAPGVAQALLGLEQLLRPGIGGCAGFDLFVQHGSPRLVIGNGLQVQAGGVGMDSRQRAVGRVLKGQQHLHARLQLDLYVFFGQQRPVHGLGVYRLEAVTGRHQAPETDRHHCRERYPIRQKHDDKTLCDAQVVQHGGPLVVRTRES